MFANKKKISLGVALLVLCMSIPAWAGGSNVTISDIEASQKQLIQERLKAEILKVRQEQRKAMLDDSADNKTSPPTTSGIAAANSSMLAPPKHKKEMRLVAVYGVADKLTADMAVDGTVVSVRQNDFVNGWKVRLIRPSRIVLVKKGKIKDFTLSVIKNNSVAIPPQMQGNGMMSPYSSPYPAAVPSQ